MERTSLSKLKDSRLALVLAIELVALVPFMTKIVNGRAYVLWSHYILRPCFYLSICLLVVGLILGLRIKNRRLGLLAVILFSIPMFLLPILEITIITCIHGY